MGLISVEAADWNRLPTPASVGILMSFSSIKQKRESIWFIFIFIFQIDVVRCLVKKRVHQKNIAILSPYREQRQRISDALKKETCKEVLVTTITKSQGNLQLVLFLPFNLRMYHSTTTLTAKTRYVSTQTSKVSELFRYTNKANI